MQKKVNKNFKSFAECVIGKVTKIADRAIAFLYFRAIKTNTGATIRDIIFDFEIAGLGKPNFTKLKGMMKKDKRTIKIGKNKWRLRADKIKEVELKLNITDCLKIKKQVNFPKSGKTHGDNFVDSKRIKELKKIKNNQFDLQRLIKMIEELNDAFSSNNCISVILLTRAIIDHVPPIFGCNNFSEVANNYKGAKSFKEAMLYLNSSSRKIADAYLHIKIRRKETLPNKTQVNFSNDLDVLLAEITRIL